VTRSGVGKAQPARIAYPEPPVVVTGTPIAWIAMTIDGRPRTVGLKLEGANPSGSVKDRTAAALIKDLDRRRLLHRESIIVESTSGNLGVALATIARRRGLRFQAIVDPKITPENLARLLALGTHVECVTQPDDGGGYLLSRLRRVHGLCASSDRFVWPDQYTNPANPWAHEHGTGPELLAQSAGELDAVLVPVSTGGTLAGIARCLRREAPATRLVAVDVRGSVALGGQPAPRLLTGIGASRSSAFLSAAMFDERIFVADAEAFAFCRALVAATGIWIGGSSGATLAASVRLLTAQSGLERIVCVCPDRGERYASTIYNDRWLAERGIDPDDLTIDPVPAIRCAPRALIAA
jgi:2,3-diaminopropionate biosynthesis protein SbnA